MRPWPRCWADWPGCAAPKSLPGAGARKRSDVRSEARSIALEAGATVGLAVDARARGDDMVITIGVATPLGLERERRLGFLGGAQGRTRAALLAAAALLPRLRAASA